MSWWNPIDWGKGIIDFHKDAIEGLTGKTQADAQTAANEQNVALAREVMDFQREMSNTAYSRAYKDMLAAGLNPVLAAGSPASTPSGSQATVNPVTQKGDAMAALPGKGVSIASGLMGLANTANDIKVKQSQVGVNSSIQASNLSSALKNKMEAEKIKEEMGYVKGRSRSADDEATANIATAQARTEMAKYEKDYAGVSFILKKIGEAFGVVKGGVDLVPKFGSKKMLRR
jgi:hypothetical protein